MKITQLQLTQVGIFHQARLLLAPQPEHQGNVTIVTGYSSSGKSLLLRTLANALSWYSSRLKDGSAGLVQPDQDITHGYRGAKVEVFFKSDVLASAIEASNPTKTITIEVSVGNNPSQTQTVPVQQMQSASLEKSWILHKTLNEQNAGISRVELDSLMLLVNEYKKMLHADALTNLPMLAYFPVERSVAELSMANKIQPSGQMTGLDPAPQMVVNFTRFFEWFRDQEDLENERLANSHRSVFTHPDHYFQAEEVSELYSYLDFAHRRALTLPLDCVRRAIEMVMPDLSHLRFERHPSLKILLNKKGKSINIIELPQSDKTLMSMVGDIARRLVALNPSLDNPLHGEGIVIIDELEMHLHPEVQRSILTRLTKAFPNCQFVVSTLSPFIYEEFEGALIYTLNQGNIEPMNTHASYSLDQIVANYTAQLSVEHLSTISQAEAVVEDEIDSDAQPLEMDLPTLNKWFLAQKAHLKKLEKQVALTNSPEAVLALNSLKAQWSKIVNLANTTS